MMLLNAREATPAQVELIETLSLLPFLMVQRIPELFAEGWDAAKAEAFEYVMYTKTSGGSGMDMSCWCESDDVECSSPICKNR